MRNQHVGKFPRRGYERHRDCNGDREGDCNGDREGENRGLTLRPKFPKFQGGDSLEWVYRAERFFHYHGTTEDQKGRVEFGDSTTTADPSSAHVINQAFPHTFGQPLAHLLRATAKVPDAQIIIEHPAMRVGIVFCGRQSPGGHNVVLGLQNALKIHNPDSVLLGFVGGTEGFFAQKTLEITDDVLSTYKNQGGYDLLGRTKDQIRTTEQVNAAVNTCHALKLDGLVIIGGVTSNSDAAQACRDLC